MYRIASRGLSLIELTVVLALLGVVASMALPSYQSQMAKTRRSEAIAALTQLMLAQEQFRAQHGSYALRQQALSGLGGPLQHFDIDLAASYGTGYIARATARSKTAARDGCHELTLTVSDGHAAQGPSDHCWNR
jgi:type IV pilus assembly protein PilE